MEFATSSLALAGGAAALGLLWYSRKRLQDSREPPSVGRYPIVGSLFHLEEPMYLALHERFGTQAIVRVHFGTQCVYVFNRWSAFKAAMVDNADQLAGRMSQTVVSRLLGGKAGDEEGGGIVNSEGEVWREYRRFTLKTLRDFGFGRRGAEEIVTVEAEHLRRTLDAAGGMPVETSLLLSTATSNVICQLVFGSRLASEDARFGEIVDLFRKITQNSSTTTNNYIFLSMAPIVERIPSLMSLILRLPEPRKIAGDFNKLQVYCNEQRDKHAAQMDGVDRARDYIEAHLMHQQTRPGMFTDTRLTLAVSDLFIAGTDTTANTLRWAILYMIDNPEVAEKTHSEIVDNIGRERLPTMQDKTVLHYTQAVIEEVHRKACLVPLGLFHRVTDDITVEGVKIKANSICTFNVFNIHHDPELFPEPGRFLPERHLNGGQFVPCPHLAAFGLGRRACLGESLARMELFILFTTLVQRYRLSLDPDETRTLWDLTEDPSFSKGTILRIPPQHKIVFTPRT